MLLEERDEQISEELARTITLLGDLAKQLDHSVKNGGAEEFMRLVNLDNHSNPDGAKMNE